MHTVLMVVHSGPLLFEEDLRLVLPDDLLLRVVQGTSLPAELPPCDVVVQSGLGEPPDQGFVLLRRLRELAPNAPIVVCSSHESEAMKLRVHELAKARYVTRPTQEQEFKDFAQFLRGTVPSPPVPD